ncbi:hypothetical protein [Paenibacillus sp. HB172176]|uniref:hypothetical protein n=1 Tax=Paenibacillus sp. HB172176 TaxID=2493690 RepID=UPI00143C7EDA|nr:hypothetical protein [Paenibacillus sp. HB172176]
MRMRVMLLLFVASLIALLAGCADSQPNLSIDEVEAGFHSGGLLYTVQKSTLDSKKNMVYNHIAPSSIFEMDTGRLIKVYLYMSEKEMNIGLEEWKEELAKDKTYGLKDSALAVKNAMFISNFFTEEEQKAIEGLK